MNMGMSKVRPQSLSLLSVTYEYKVDSKLAKESSLAAVSEILNGCMYVVLIDFSKL